MAIIFCEEMLSFLSQALTQQAMFDILLVLINYLTMVLPQTACNVEPVLLSLKMLSLHPSGDKNQGKWSHPR